MQGMGRWTMEEIKFSPTGVMTTTNPHSYYIPTSADVPRDMRITLLGDSPSPTAVHSSKAVGEPPFFLSSCVFFALKVRSLFFFFVFVLSVNDLAMVALVPLVLLWNHFPLPYV